MIERFKNDKKFNTAVKLCIYILFVIIVAIYAVANHNALSINENLQEKIEENLPKIETTTNNTNNNIILSENYKYQIEINLDDVIYKYNIEKNNNEIQIEKETNKEKTNYILKDNNYYIDIDNKYILSSEKKVFDLIDNNYLSIDTINNYINESTYEDNQYTIYLKNIILDTDNNEYITITIEDNIINIDYTELMKELNIADYNCNVNIEIEE